MPEQFNSATIRILTEEATKGRIMLKGIVIFFALLSGGIAYVSGWGQTDDELSGSSRKWLNLSETGTPNEAPFAGERCPWRNQVISALRRAWKG